MSEPLQPKGGDESPLPQEAKLELLAKLSRGQTIEQISREIAAAVRVNLEKGDKEPDREGGSDYRSKLLKCPEVEALNLANRTIVAARKQKDNDSIPRLSQEYIEAVQHVSQVFLKDAEAECAKPELDVTKTRALIHFCHSYAKSVTGDPYKNLDVLNALKEWQAKMAKESPEAVRKILRSYALDIFVESAAKKPDVGWMQQWIDLSVGFAPELEQKLIEKLQEGAMKRCEYFMRKTEEFLALDPPNIEQAGYQIIVPPKFYQYLEAGSTIPERMKLLEERFAALKK